MSLQQKSVQYLAQLEQFCKTLQRSQDVQKHAPALCAGASQLLFSVQGNKKRLGNFTLKLKPNWKIESLNSAVCGIPGHTELHFGGEIEFQDDCLHRQVISVVVLFRPDASRAAYHGYPALVAGENYVVRRLHFDFDLGAVKNSTPLAHLQIGGTLNTEFLELDETVNLHYEQFDSLAHPRLPWTITDPAIIMDTFLRQFPTAIQSFVLGKEWFKCVVASERLWLADFYGQAAILMRNEGQPQSFYEHTCVPEAFGHE